MILEINSTNTNKMRNELIIECIALLNTANYDSETLSEKRTEIVENLKEQLTIPAVSNCDCTPDETTGTTTVRCCNICGFPVESFWRCGYESEQLKDKKTPTFESWLKMNNYELYKNAEYKDENDCSWFTNELLKMYERELTL